MRAPRRFACWTVRRAVSRSLDEDSPLPGTARDHLANCAECRQSYEAQKRMVEELSASSNKGGEETPAFLRARIMLGIKGGPAFRKRPVFSGWARAVGAFSVCVLLGLILWRENRAGPGVRPAPGAGAGPAFAELSAALQFPDQTQVARWIGRIDGPLENEMQLVVDDAKTAYDSLAGSILPSNNAR